ncbi:MAG: molybdopterin molybdotransferase MoeA, partial [Planctomycetota bacterium]
MDHCYHLPRIQFEPSSDACGNAMKFQFDGPDPAIAALCAGLQPVDPTPLALRDSIGRVLAQPVVLDRDSPACDVSAMDGFALNQADLGAGPIPVCGTVAAGMPPIDCLPGHAVRIFTGAPLPASCDCVIRREDILSNPETSDASVAGTQPQQNQSTIQINDAAQQSPLLANIRRKGENAVAGKTIVDVGQIMGAAQIAASATCGVATPNVARRVRVSVLTTGDEVCEVSDSPQPWQVRDSNAATLTSLFSGKPWIDLNHVGHANDDPQRLEVAMRDAAGKSDVVVLTGGVSVGDHDYVPRVLGRCGGETVFHKLPIRPGKPVLGGILQG